MRVPLEVLCIVLDYAATSYTRKELLQLRLASKLFSEEALSAFFSTLYAQLETEVAFGSSWEKVPVSLREKYIYHLIERGKGVRYFTTLVRPVFRQHLEKLGIGPFDRVARHDRIKVWCQFFMHEHWRIGWVIAHARCEYVERLDWFYDECWRLNQPERRIENDRKFLEICCAIVEDDAEVVLQAFEGFHSGVDDLNHCFGTTLLGFTIKWGTLDMLTLLLRSVRSTRRKHLYIYLRLAAARKTESDAMRTMLLDRFSGFDTAKTAFAKELLIKAVANNDQVLSEAVMLWITATPNFPDKLGFMEWLFEYLKEKSNLKTSWQYPVPKEPVNEVLEMDLASSFYVTMEEENVVDEVQAEHRRIEAIMTSLRKFLAPCHLNLAWKLKQKRKSEQQRPVVKLETKPPTPLFFAASKGLIHWVDWLLWAGADARHESGEPSLLDFAWQEQKRKEVTILLFKHGWNPGRLALKVV